MLHLFPKLFIDKEEKLYIRKDIVHENKLNNGLEVFVDPVFGLFLEVQKIFPFVYKSKSDWFRTYNEAFVTLKQHQLDKKYVRCSCGKVRSNLKDKVVTCKNCGDKLVYNAALNKKSDFPDQKPSSMSLSEWMKAFNKSQPIPEYMKKFMEDMSQSKVRTVLFPRTRPSNNFPVQSSYISDKTVWGGIDEAVGKDKKVK